MCGVEGNAEDGKLDAGIMEDSRSLLYYRNRVTYMRVTGLATTETVARNAVRNSGQTVKSIGVEGARHHVNAAAGNQDRPRTDSKTLS